MADGRLRRAKLKFERNFTQIPNEWLRDNQLSLRARGLLAMLMSHDEGYVVTHKSIVAANPEGREAIEGAVRELKAGGYLDVIKTRGRNGRIEGYMWELTDPEDVKKRRSEPLTGFPEYGSTVLRSNRSPVNQHLKEQHFKEDLTKELKTGNSTGAQTNEDAFGGCPQTQIEDPAETLKRDLHARCNFFARGHHECEWAASGYCVNCARPRPVMVTVGSSIEVLS